MTIGGFEYDKMKEVDATATPIFVFTYLIVVYIMFVKMFIVVLDAYYRELDEACKGRTLSMFQYSIKVLVKLGNDIQEKIDKFDARLKSDFERLQNNEIAIRDGDLTKARLSRCAKCCISCRQGFYKLFIIVLQTITKFTRLILLVVVNIVGLSGSVDIVQERSREESYYGGLLKNFVPPPVKKGEFRLQNLKVLKDMLSAQIQLSSIKPGDQKVNDKCNFNTWMDIIDDFLKVSSDGHYGLNNLDGKGGRLMCDDYQNEMRHFGLKHNVLYGKKYYKELERMLNNYVGEGADLAYITDAGLEEECEAIKIKVLEHVENENKAGRFVRGSGIKQTIMSVFSAVSSGFQG